ncbi:MAG: UDP-N-acetylmuramoyl-tripeptide--D-alanyl-D-alanine ligase [Herbinix sp.]|nr:UDP-N-acetylmuramoyl-tripeptide--D-alanyl-D-alanine ligase [Herbinix sp.]
MKNMTLTQITKACGGKLFNIGNYTDVEVAGVVIDSRMVEKDSLFIATVGERVDGHNYINTAFDQGAIAVVCEKVPVDAKGPYILVEDSFTALKSIAKWYRMQLSIKVVGITGSVGKTSTKEFISSVLARKYNVLKTEGNFNNEVGLPLTVLKIRNNHEVAVLEMGISDFGEMHRLSEIAKPDICVITNIGQCHLENLGSRQGILKAKTEIFDFMSETGRVCINGDDDMLARLGEVKGNKPVKFGISADNDVLATNIETHGLFGSTCDIHINNVNLESNSSDKTDHILQTTIPLPGGHMVLNALAATSVGLLLDMSCEEIVAGIATVQAVGGRSNIIRHDKWTIIDDCYNANPVSMKAAIDLLGMADTKKLAILGDMFELGNTEEALHNEVGKYAISGNVDLLICVGKLSLHMYKGATEILNVNTDGSLGQSDLNKKQELLYFETRNELITALPNIIKENDTILVKASHGMGFEEVVKTLLQG